MRILILRPVTFALALLAAGPAFADVTANFTCADGQSFEATFSPPSVPNGSVVLRSAAGKKLKLPQAPSADGGRYAKADIEFWVKGNGARLTVNGKETQCQAKS